MVPMKPVNMKKAGAETLAIEWDSGEVTYYPLDFLRRRCPCASCSEARGASQTKTNPLRILQPHEIIGQGLDLLQAEVVGRYALNFVWSDGHREGIYTFDFLRELAEDPICRALAAEMSLAERKSPEETTGRINPR